MSTPDNPLIDAARGRDPVDQQPHITAISVFVEVDGRLCLAPIAPVLSMLSAYQAHPEKGTTLYPVPDEARDCVFRAGQIIGDRINKGRKT